MKSHYYVVKIPGDAMIRLWFYDANIDEVRLVGLYQDIYAAWAACERLNDALNFKSNIK